MKIFKLIILATIAAASATVISCGSNVSNEPSYIEPSYIEPTK